jgi:hypothetical protein
MQIQVSKGELIDKWSILKIKYNKIDDEAKLRNVYKEFDYLTQQMQLIYLDLDQARHLSLETTVNSLCRVNEQLWDIEDKIRLCELRQQFDENFIELARSVYMINDQRANLKKVIDRITNSEFTEEKQYTQYT